jgi:hypothetical protein
MRLQSVCFLRKLRRSPGAAIESEGGVVMPMRLPKQDSVIAAGLMCAIALAIAACTGGQPSTSANAEVAVASDAVNRARSNGGLEAAEGAMVQAQQKLSGAQAAIANGDSDQAALLAAEAKADADLADTTARAAQARRAATAVQQDVNTLRQQGSP